MLLHPLHLRQEILLLNMHTNQTCPKILSPCQISKSFIRLVASGFLVGLLVLVGPIPAYACGWWGDGEQDDNDAIVIGANGRPVSEANPDELSGLKVPGREGYGMVVQRDGRAVPYLIAVDSQPLNSIGQLYKNGFLAVIDLGANQQAAGHHRKETETLGMKYFNIPIDGTKVDRIQVSVLGKIFTNPQNLPILVYAMSADQLGRVWAYHRMSAGINELTAVQEGQALGLSAKILGDLK